MVEIDVEAFKREGFSFEEIEGIKEGLLQAEKGETISESEMNNFISNELFAKYKTNV